MALKILYEYKYVEPLEYATTEIKLRLVNIITIYGLTHKLTDKKIKD
jgi:hypothetical protein